MIKVGRQIKKEEKGKQLFSINTGVHPFPHNNKCDGECVPVIHKVKYKMNLEIKRKKSWQNYSRSDLEPE